MNTHAYIGRKECGCVVAAVVDDPKYKKDTAQSVAEFLEGGLTIERVTLDETRELLKVCKHRQDEQQQELL